MNREIKFRAWDSLNKKMIWGPTEGTINSAWVFTLASGGGYEEVIHLMQFTGYNLHGQELYESDFVINLEAGLKYEIVWSNKIGSISGWTLYSHLTKEYYNFLGIHVMEIIGNRYSNPELIKEG